MFRLVAGLSNCLSGKHERSERQIFRNEAKQYISKCAHCGVPMKRRAKRDWVAISRAEYRELHGTK